MWKGIPLVKSLGEISRAVGAQLIGDDSIGVSDAKTTNRAARHDITLATTAKHLQIFFESECLVCVVPQSLEFENSGLTDKTFLVVDQVETAFAKIVGIFRPAVQRTRIGISPNAQIAASAQIAEDADIYPGAYIGENVKIGCGCVIHPGVSVMDHTSIGAGTTLFPNVTIYENSIIGERCLLHGGVVIGAYGFGYKSSATHELSAQLGNVVIGNDVEIGANSTIDRGTYDSTTVGDGTKIDNLVMIGHNCQIGKHNLLCSQVGIAGSTTTGDYVVMAGQVGVGDHLNIGNQVMLSAQSGVMHNLECGNQYMGSPAIQAREYLRQIGTINKLPEFRKQLRKLQKLVESQLQQPQDKQEAA